MSGRNFQPTRHPAFWIAYVAVASLSAALAWHLFPQAIPLVNLDIKMSRQDAVSKAEQLAREHKLVADGARSAARFRNDQAAQNYVELEGGGKPAFAQLVAGTAFSPYWWEVRLFNPGDVEEVVVRFRPDGEINGFSRRIAETRIRDAARKALDPAAALELAKSRATRDWNVDFASYHKIEDSQETQPSGRVDHHFVFERDEGIADARIRLGVSIAGDELIGVARYMHVPEKFERRFAEMRSANNTIANFASIAAGVLYGIGGCILAVLWLLRERWLLWRPALMAGAVVGTLLAGALLASAPYDWFGYDTAGTVDTFWNQLIAAAVGTLFASTVGLGIVFMAAESLTRRAFPHHPQLWQLWSRDAGTSKQVLGRTVGGYLFVPIELALIAAFYYATNHWLGWWQPSESMTDPNILSSTFPALTPIALSLQAGFMEECAFRAIPLAMAALLGARFGHRTLWIGGAVVLQAVIFAGAHANYPGLPAYSRLVELLVPAILWALIFLRFGLLPTILLHALFDLSLFSIPLFLVDAPGAWIQRAIVIAAAVAPLAVVVVRRAQSGAWRELPAAFWNGAWRPMVQRVEEVSERARTVAVGTLGTLLQRALPWMGIAGAVAWVLCTPFVADVPTLPIDRAQATSVAVAALAKRGVVLGAEWKILSGIRSGGEAGQSPGQRFVWREAGADAYRALAGKTLPPPMWEVRFARFEGDVTERAEEWWVTVFGDGQVRQVQHRLPEAAPGASLERDAALALAQHAVAERFGADPATLHLRTADQVKRDARRDWTFVFADPAINVGKDGEARVQIGISGDEVTSYGRSIFVPEAWQRAETERDNRLQVLKYGALFATVLGALAALVFAVLSWNRGQCDKRAMWQVGALVFAVAVIDMANAWPEMALRLLTTEPVMSQVATTIAGGLFAALMAAGLAGLLFGVGSWFARAHPPATLATQLPAWAVGVTVALAVAGMAAISGTLAPRAAPLWPALKLPELAWPIVGALVDPVGVVGACGVALFVLFLLDRVTNGWTRRPWVAAVLLVLISCAAALVGDGDPLAALSRGVVKGLVSFVLLWQVLRYDVRTIPAFLATGMLLEGARNAALEGTATAWMLFALSAAVAVAATWAVTRHIARPLPAATLRSPSTE